MNPLSSYLLTPGTSHYRIIDASAKRAIRVSDIIERTAKAHGLKASDLLCASRSRALVYPRFEAMYQAAAQTQLSYPQIGRAFAGRDHSTVMHGIRAHAQRLGLPLPRTPKPEGAV